MGNVQTPGRREDPHCARWPTRRDLNRRTLPARRYRREHVLLLVEGVPGHSWDELRCLIIETEIDAYSAWILNNETRSLIRSHGPSIDVDKRAAIDRQRNAGDEMCLVGCQKQRCIRDVPAGPHLPAARES